MKHEPCRPGENVLSDKDVNTVYAFCAMAAHFRNEPYPPKEEAIARSVRVVRGALFAMCEGDDDEEGEN